MNIFEHEVYLQEKESYTQKLNSSTLWGQMVNGLVQLAMAEKNIRIPDVSRTEMVRKKRCESSLVKNNFLGENIYWKCFDLLSLAYYI